MTIKLIGLEKLSLANDIASDRISERAPAR
jgi:hypothetical protein